MRTGPSRETRGLVRTFHSNAGQTSLFSGAGVAADERPIEKIANADRERDDAERGNSPDVAIRLDTRNQPERSDVAERPANEQDAGTAGTRRLVQFRLHRNVDSAGNRREPLFAAKFAHAVIRVKRTERDPHSQGHRHQSNQFSAHDLLLLKLIRQFRRRLLWVPLSSIGTPGRRGKFPNFRENSLFHPAWKRCPWSALVS